ncbi:ABC transporter ATP-binding protein [Phaeobacter sp. B1627]|uniref:ATP-binding cassette domain-containing protein n=1 Tax=Phaeobacter sp. B1627 TaxID=2583809 RepID=UPI0021025C02|nr:ABC transporter ATP-binding protein [Phaeobacter sp. B1627]
MIQKLFDSLTIGSRAEAINALWTLAAVAIFLLILNYLAAVQRAASCMRMGRQLTSELVHSVVFGGGQNMPVGEITSRMQDVSQLHIGITDAAVRTVTEVLFLVAATFYAFNLNPLLTALAWIGFPVSFYIARLNGRMVHGPTQRTLQRQAEYVSLLISGIENRQEAGHFGGARWIEQAIIRRQEGLFRRQFSIQKIAAKFSSLGAANTKVVEISVLVIGAFSILQDNLTIGGLMAFYLMLSRLTNPLTLVAGLADDWKRVQISLLRAEPLLMKTDAPVTATEHLKPEISLTATDLLISRGHKNPIRLNEFSIYENEMIFLNAPVGSGKTRLLRTLAKYPPPMKGAVSHPHSQPVLYLGSRPFLMKGSLRSNILLGLDKNDIDIINIAENLNIAHILSGIPSGLDTRINADGSGISEGQRQIVGVLRCFLRDPKVVLLDEATSHLDQGTEEGLHTAILGWGGGLSTIVASHRGAPFPGFGVEYTIHESGLLVLCPASSDRKVQEREE